MAGTAADELYRMFQDAAGSQAAGLGEVRYALEEVIAQLGVVQQSATQATQASTTTKQSSSSGGSGGADSTFVQVLKSGLGIAPLVGGLISLFSGGSEEPPPLVKYALPAAVNFQGAESGRATHDRGLRPDGDGAGICAAAGRKRGGAGRSRSMCRPWMRGRSWTGAGISRRRYGTRC